MSMRLTISLLALVAVLLVGSVAVYRHFSGETEAASGLIVVSGNIEVTDAEASFKIPGRVAVREVTEGEVVRAGQVIARLEEADLVQEVALRRAEAEVAGARLAELEAGSRPEEIAQAEAGLELAQAQATRAELEYDRQKGLHDKEVATTRELEVAVADLKTTQARVREAQERLALLREGPRREEIDQARGRLRQAKEALALAETRLSYATLVSPLTGLVLSKNVEPGEYVAPGTPIVTVGDLEHPWLRAYISETDLGRVQVGQKVWVTTDTYPDKRYEGRISFIASQSEFTPKNVQTQKQRVKLVYRIKVEMPNPDLELKPGMPADAQIQLGEARATARKSARR